MNAPVVALLLAVAALVVAPMLAWATAKSTRLESALDGFVFVLVAGVALLHLGPHAIDHGGLTALVGIAAGAVLPVVFGRSGRTRLWVTTALGVLGFHALVEGAAASSHSVRIAGPLYSDAMGSPGTYRGTLIGMLDHNATTITRALGGQAAGYSPQLAER